MAKRTSQHFGGVLFDKDLPLKGEPGRKCIERFLEERLFGMCGDSALDHIAVRVSCVAIRATKGASDVRIDGPETHLRDVGSVEHRLRTTPEIPDVFLLAQDRQRSALETPFRVGIKQRT